ncbi:DNA polymerase IV [Micrococcus lylae]|uniref:DNA polymerase IV n=1 Tax=Micrococcus lylae TaxID=1273 RepID=UPI000C800D09|nr:DNA polymerase IV [Micrococcus lylae]WIK83092.1 DNA polymerase IV [Micrococcus lylae]
MQQPAPVDPGDDATVLHVDMDAFFLSVELRERPDLRGVPAAVAGRSLRSVILSASYEARAFGVRSAMPVGQALRLCPQLRLVEPRQSVYRSVSAEVMALLDRVTPVREQLSVDEAFLDVAGSRRRLGPPARIGAAIRERVRAELGLPCSVGAAPVKFVAKMASTAAKPDGLVVVPGERLLEFLHPRPIDHLWGVGPVLALRLRTRGIDTIGDAAALPEGRLRQWFGEVGARVEGLSRGLDPRPVHQETGHQSIGADHTFDDDPTDPEEIDRHVLRLCHHVAGRLRAEGVLAGGVTVRVKSPEARVRSRAARLPDPTDSGHDLFAPARRAVRELLADRPHPLRLVGVRAERLTDEQAPRQQSLFDDEAGGRAADWGAAERAVDAVRRRFPGLGPAPASLLGDADPAADGRDRRQ